MRVSYDEKVTEIRNISIHNERRFKMKCEVCNHKSENNFSYCPECGTPVDGKRHTSKSICLKCKGTKYRSGTLRKIYSVILLVIYWGMMTMAEKGTQMMNAELGIQENPPIFLIKIGGAAILLVYGFVKLKCKTCRGKGYIEL